MTMNKNPDIQKKLIKDYWLAKLSRTAEYSSLPGPFPQAGAGNSTCSRSFLSSLSFPLPPAAVDPIKTISKNNPVTEFIINLAVWGILLYKYFNTPELWIVSPGLRENPEPDGGNTLLFFRLEISPGDSLKEIFSNTRGEVLESFAHAIHNYGELKETLAGNFPGAAAFYRYGICDRRIHGESGEFENVDLRLALEMQIGEGLEPQFEIKYDQRRYQEVFVRQLAAHFVRLLGDTRDNLDKQVVDMEILSPVEKRHIIEDFNDIDTSSRPVKTIPGIFAEQAVRFPGRVALQYRSRQNTYRALDESADQLAQLLREKGVQYETLVGIKLERSIEMIVGILGILKTGGAYLPIDPDYPPERIDFMLKDSNALILIDEKFFGGFRGAVLQKSPPFQANLAYLIYTSGSTGKPKGVMVEHRNVVNLLFNDKFPFQFSEEDTWTLFHSICFDFSVWEIFGALLYGGRAVVVPLETARTPRLFAQLLRKDRVTILNQIPTMFYNLAPELLESKDGPGTLYLRYIVFGGEALNPTRLSKWRREYPGVKLVNMYGITETTVHVTYKEISSEDIEAGISPIGKPLAAWSCHILDEHLNVVPAGIPGEILVGGKGVARGYLNRVELTHDRFIKVPGIDEARLYRSGDSGQRCFDGSIEYLGRIDAQVKIRGFRIECGEIEKCLLELAAVRDVNVVVGEDKDNNRYLAAYIVDTGEEDAGEARYRNYLESRLPEYMIPQYFVRMEKFPLTPSGKVDKKALPQPGYRRPGGSLYEAPSNEVEKGLAAIWEEVLGVEPVGIHENFFNLGGDSIKGIHVVNKIQKWLGEIMHVSVIFEAPTIRELAEKIESYRKVSKSVVDETKIEKFLHILRPLPSFPAQLPKNPPVVFVLSPPRSGSTLLRVILAGHPQLFAPPELELLSFNTLRDRKAELSGRFAYFAEGAVRAIMELKGCGSGQAQAMMEEFENAGLTVQEFYRVLQNWQEGQNGRMLIDKTPFYTLDPEVLKRAEEYFESPRYIHLLRDPYASIHSFEEAKLDQIFRYSHEFTVRELAELVWLTSNRNIIDFLDNIPPERQLTLKFEHLVQEPEASARRICRFLGIDYYPGMIQVYGNFKGKMIDGIHPESKMLGDIKFLQHKAIDAGVVNKWKNKHEMGLGDLTLELAGRLGYLENKKKGDYTGIMPITGRSHYRLSHAQKRMWLLEQFDKHRSAYNISGVHRVEGAIDRDALQNAFAAAVKRHESLRTVFCMEEGEPVQKIRDYEDIGFKLEYIDMSCEKQGYERTRLLINEEVTKSFDLEKGPLLRAGLIRLDEAEYVLFFILPHIISDGWSLGILLKEFIALYSAYKEGNPDPLPPLRIQYKDFCQWQGRIITEELLERQEIYWLDYFKGEIPALDLPTDYPRPVFQSFNGANVNFELDGVELGHLKAFSEEENATLFMVLLTAYSIFLAMITGREDMVLGTPIAGRNHEDLRAVVGMFVNTLALRVRPSGYKTIKEFLSETRQCILSAFENQDYPFEALVEKVAVNRDVSRNPVFDVAFALQGMFMNPGEMPDLRGTGLNIKPFEYENKISKFDMGFYGAEAAGKLIFSIEYCTELFKRETIERFSSYFKRVIAAMTGDPAKQISAVEIISADEKKQVLYDFNDTAVEYPREKTIHCLYEEQAAQTPDHIVIVGFVELDRSVRTVRPVSLSYSELNMQSHRLAGLLIKKGVLSNDIVAIKMARSIEMVIAILGTLKSGGAYMPIDPDYPQERVDYMLKDSNARILINKSEARISKFETNSNDRNPNRISDSNFSNLAYVIYTSGSTGKPKGVMVGHRSVIRLVINNDFVELSEPMRVLQTGAPVFDAVTFEMWGPLLNGGQLCLVDNEVILYPGKLGRALKKYHINTLWLTSSLFNQLARQDSTIFSTLEWLVVGGDVLSPGYIAEVRRKNNHLKMVNGYGPTENTTFSVCHCIDRDYPNNIPIGKPIANSCAYILDKRGHLQPIGIPGELYVGGDGLARGYLNNPELTAEKFNKDLWDYQDKQDEKNKSFAGVKGGLFQKPPLVTYKTGDLARWLPGGVIEFLGRIDRQVKIRGFRVELEEIENRLVGHEEIKEAVVTVDGGEDKSLCAYITGAREFGADELRGYLGLELPAYMIPAYFVQLEKLPLTVNGKVDRLALPAPQLSLGEKYIAPADEIEEKIVGIWTNVLGVKKDAIGVNDDFFHLGGHSLKATLLASQVSKTFNVEFPLTAVFTGPTVKEMANVVRRGRKSLYGEIKPVEKREYYPLSSAQKRLYFLEQLENIGVSYNIPAVLKVEGELDKSLFKQAVDDLIQRHEALRTSFCLVNNEPAQVIHDRVDMALNLENIDHETQDLHDVHEILEYSMRFIRPFDLSRAPLLRVALVALREGGYFLFYDIHHIICDGTSLGTLITDFIKLYFQEELLPLKIQYKDFTLWQNGWFESGAIKKQQEYWLNVYKDISGSGGKIPRLNLPTDYPRPDIQTFTGEKYEFKLESENLANLNRLKTRYGTTLYMNLLAVFNVLLFKYTDREDIIVGSGIGERTHADMQGFLGMFVNTLAMRNHPRPGMTFADFLKQVKENCIQAFENQNMQFEELVERLEIKREPTHNPLFDVEFNLQNFMTDENDNHRKILETGEQKPGNFKPGKEPENVRFINLGLPNKTSSKFDMILFAQEVKDEVLFLLEYATALFKKETIQELARHYIEIIKQITTDEEILLNDIRISHDFVTALPGIEDNEFGF